MTYDLLIIGGGINGCAIAREAALNGWTVLLVEKDDLANHTSSASTKLIHGGLRYLETYEFKMVREALQERKLLMAMAPHLIHPKSFVLPQENSPRPWFLVRAGLYLYDLLAGSGNLARSRRLKRSDALFQLPLKRPGSGFVYSDCSVDDARLTVLNAVDAAKAGAVIRTRTALVSTKRNRNDWVATLSDGTTVMAKAVINAAGPWVLDVETKTGMAARNSIRLVKGSHIVVPRLYAGEHAYMLQQKDRRIVFTVPWTHDTTMIGTTEENVDTPENPTISAEETNYLIDAANLSFVRQSTKADIIYDWAGVRPLFEDGAVDARTATRDYVLELNIENAPVLAIFGGKITTARHLAEEAVGKMGVALGRPTTPATRARHFPGGQFPASFDRFVKITASRWPFLGAERADRMARAYGTMLNDMLAGIDSAKAMGVDFGGGLTALEVDWLVAHEWAQTAEDILWRRTKIGLATAKPTLTKLTKYLEDRRNAARH
ncbi:MAG: glycerol-3-phosphate dehydrogenase [Chakrabartia sp.]